MAQPAKSKNTKSTPKLAQPKATRSKLAARPKATGHAKQKSPAAASSQASAPAITYTLPGLVARLGAATEQEVSPFIKGLTKSELVQEGRKIGTSRIDTDTARLYGIAADFFDRATEEQLDAVMGVSPEMLRVSVWAANKGSELAAAEEKDGKAGGAAKARLVTTAQALRESGMKRRRALRRGLSALAGGDAELIGRIDSANGTADSPRSSAPRSPRSPRWPRSAARC
jgi:hypothetical protein